MKLRYLALLGLLGLVCAQSSSSEEGSDEDWEGMSPEEDSVEDRREDVQCSGMMCRMYCPLGFHHDTNGCPTCSCIEDPCELMDCDEGTYCKPAPHCTGVPCYSMKAECVPEVPDMPCAMPMCADPCDNGYRTDANGCMTCECQGEPQDELCRDHPCDDLHTCVAVQPPLCALVGDGMCEKKPMCLPNAHGGMFLPHLPDHIPGEVPDFGDVPDVLNSMCKFRKGMAEKFAEEAKIKYGNNTMLRKLLQHRAMHNPWCSDDGKFLPLQCHGPDRECWCVNDRGHPIKDSRTKVHSKTDVPKCAEHVTERIEGSFMLQHQFDDIEPHLTELASVVQDHLAAWMDLDHAQIVIRQVSQTSGGLIEVHFEVARSAENELHSAQLMLGWHLGKKECRVPFMDGELVPIHKSLKMEHHTSMVDSDGNVVADLPEHGLYWRESKHHPRNENEFVRLYKHNKVAVIVGGVGIFLFVILVIAIIVTVCKRARVTSNQFKPKRLSEKSNKYKENLAFANEIYGKQMEKAEPEVEEKEEEEKKEEEKKEENATEA